MLLWAIVALLAAILGLQESNTSRRRLPAATLGVIAIWLALIVVTVAHGVFGRSPMFIVAPIATAMLLCAALSAVVLLIGQNPARRQRLLSALMSGLVAAALLNVMVAAVQSWAPGWADDDWIARLATAGDRVGGNLRQPNQLATLMVWGMLAATWLGWQNKALWLGLCAPMLVVLIATGSRSGVLSLALVIAAALLRSRSLRRLRLRGWFGLLLALLVIGWFAESVFSRATAGAALQQRLALWRDVLVLIEHSPWFGVGIGQLNFAWTLTPLPARAPDVFDHAHSLPLQLAAELGLPVAGLVLVALGAVVFAARTALRTRAGITVGLALSTMLLHSLLEYPLWFTYFLLPTAFLLAWFSGAANADAAAASAVAPASTAPAAARRALAIAALLSSLLVAAAVPYAIAEYGKAAAIHARSPSRAALQRTVEIARESPLYGHFGDYAAIMLADDAANLDWFARPVRHVLDERLLAAYALALERAGDHARAAFVVARAREFPPHQLFGLLPGLSPAAQASAPGTGGAIRGPDDFVR